MINSPKIYIHSLFFLLVISLGLGLNRCICQIRSISSFRYHVELNSFSPMMLLMSFIVAMLTLSFLKIKCVKLKENYKEFEFELAFFPLLLGGLFFLLPTASYTPIVFIICAGLSTLRYCNITPFPLNDFTWKQSDAVNISIISLATGIFALYGTLLQVHALKSFSMNYADWGIYFNAVDNTLKGNFFYSNELGRNYLGHHFMPGAFLLMIPVAILKNTTAVFAFNSIVLYMSSIIIYFFAKKSDISKGFALALSLIYLLLPGLSNMTLSLFYSFHPIFMTKRNSINIHKILSHIPTPTLSGLARRLLILA